VAIWILRRRLHPAAELRFVPAGSTLDDQRVDSDPAVIHVDTGGGRYDHHHTAATDICAAELVRRHIAPGDSALQRLVAQVCAIDHARARDDGGGFGVTALIAGLLAIHPDDPAAVYAAMAPNLDAWLAAEEQHIQARVAYARRIAFATPWGPGVALEGASSAGAGRLAFAAGAVLYCYRDQRSGMGVVAQARAAVDLAPLSRVLAQRDANADWYLHPGGRLLLCGSATAPPRRPSRLTLAELIEMVRQAPR
jgi:hypothetical protein